MQQQNRPSRWLVAALIVRALVGWLVSPETVISICVSVLLSRLLFGCGGVPSAGGDTSGRTQAEQETIALHERRAAAGEGWCCAPTIGDVVPEDCGLSGSEADSIRHETLTYECFCWGIVRGSSANTGGECLGKAQ